MVTTIAQELQTLAVKGNVKVFVAMFQRPGLFDEHFAGGNIFWKTV